MNFSHSPEFATELKKLQKRRRSLPGDLRDAERQITDLYVGQSDDDDLREYRAAFFNGKRATILQKTADGREVVKMRLDCESLGNKDKLRLIFIYILDGNSVCFIELYSKSDKSREDTTRIRKYLSSQNN